MVRLLHAFARGLSTFIRFFRGQNRLSPRQTPDEHCEKAIYAVTYFPLGGGKLKKTSGPPTMGCLGSNSIAG